MFWFLFIGRENRICISHGILDKNVHFHAHSKKIMEVLDKAGIGYKNILFEDEGHGFTSMSNLKRLDGEMFSFLEGS